MRSSLTLRLRALVALGAFLGGLAIPFVSVRHLAFADDVECLTPGFAGGEVVETDALPIGAVQFGDDQSTAPIGHCAVCHWLRAMGGAQPLVSALAQAALAPQALVASLYDASYSLDAVVPGPARAPPVRL